MYLMDYGLSALQEFSLSTPWNINTKSFVRQGSTGVSSPREIAISSNGEKVYIGSNSDDNYYQNQMTTPWDASTLTGDSGAIFFDPGTANPVAITISPDGTRVLAAPTDDPLKLIELSTPFELSSTKTVISMDPIGPGVVGACFFNDGYQLAVMVGGDLVVYDLPNPGEVENRFNERTWVAGIGGFRVGLHVANDASGFYTLKWDTDQIEEYSTR